MRKYCLALIFLFTLSALFFPVRVAAQDDFSEEESPAPAVTETTPLSSPETSSAMTTEATSPSSTETRSATVESAPAVSEEGANYKGVPWGADFNTFKAIKGFAGNLSPFSAAFVNSKDDNDIAMLLGAPVSAKESSGIQRVMFEYVPRKFASVYFEADDTYYIFYNGKFVMTFSNIDEKNFDFYRDTFYKKYTKTGTFAKRYEPAAKKSCLLQASIFEKGKTTAFLLKNQSTIGKDTFVYAKLIFVSNDLLNVIREDIEDKMAAEKLTGEERNKQQLEKDLLKIE